MSVTDIANRAGLVARFGATPAQVREARAWILDCEWEDLPSKASVRRLTVEQVVRGVHRNFSGGWSAFVEMSS